MHWKDFLYFSVAEKIAVLFLVVIIVLSFGLNVILSSRSNGTISIPQNDSLIAAFLSLQESLEDKEVVPKSYDYMSERKSEKSAPRERIAKTTEGAQIKTYSERQQYTKQEKFAAPSSISLNETDTTEWKKVPGVGSAYSARIVKYQKMLGGYISINQLKEVYGVTEEMFEDIAPFIREEMIGAECCIKLNINKLDFKEILAHPYIDFEQTKAIVNLRRRTGNIKSIKELAMLDEFTPKDIERISPYIDF